MRQCFLRVITISILSMILVSCWQVDSTTQVTFAVFGDPAEFAAYQDLVNSFEEIYPEIDIVVHHTPGQSEYRRKLAAEFSSGNPSDVMMLNYRRFAYFADAGGLEPLGTFLDKSSIISQSDFYPITLDAFQYQDQLWCIPQNLSSLVVYFNRDLFEQNEILLPSSGWTWEDFLQSARHLTQDTDSDGNIDQYGAGITPNLLRLAPFIWQNGGDLVDDHIAPTRLTLDQPESREAFEWFTALQVKEKVVPDALAESILSGEERFLNGSLAMYFNSRRGTPLYRTIKDFEWDVAPLPQNEYQGGILHSDAYCMASNAKNKGAAWIFIEFANSQPGQEIIARSGRTVPSLISVAESEVFISPDIPPASSQIFIDRNDTIRLVPIISTWVAIEETASREIERAFYGDISVNQAIQNTTTFTEPFFKSLSEN